VDSVWTQVALVVVLVLVNAAFAGSEMALVSLRESQVARLEQRGRAGRVLARLARDPNSFLATIQIGITLAGFLASATAAVALAEPLEGPLEPLVGGLAGPLSIVLVTLGLTYVTLVFGELAPKRVAMQRTEGWALLAARPLAGLATLTKPAVWALGISTDLAVRALGIDPDQPRDVISEDELRDMVAAQPELSDHERRIIDGAFEFADRTLRQILVPRTAVVALPADLPVAEAARRLAASGHTRAPVAEADLDDVVGTVHLRSLVDAEGTVGEHAQPALLLPETVGCLDALRQMQAHRQQMVVVISEHGGTEGIVTIEDLVEELVGDIYDEADPDVQGVVHEPDGSLVLDGAYPIHDLADVGVDLPRGGYATVAGLVMAELGRIPQPGDELGVGDWNLTVLDVADRTVASLRLTPAPASGEDDPAV
jgi:putative hemolysin